MPDGNGRRQTFKQSLTCILDRKEAALTLRTRVAFSRFEPVHQPNLRSIRQRDLLIPATHTEDRLARLFDHVKDAGQRLARVVVPGMTLSAQDYVRRFELANSDRKSVGSGKR